MNDSDSKDIVQITFKDYPDVVTINQLCKMLGIGKKMAYRLLKNGSVKHTRIGRKYVIPKVYVLQYLKLLKENEI